MRKDVKLKKFDVPQGAYFSHLREQLGMIPNNGDIILIALFGELGNNNNIFEKTPVFKYFADDKDETTKVLTWADVISTFAELFSDRKIHYLIATMTEEVFDEICELGEIGDPDLQMAIDEYTAAIAKQQ